MFRFETNLEWPDNISLRIERENLNKEGDYIYYLFEFSQKEARELVKALQTFMVDDKGQYIIR